MKLTRIRAILISHSLAQLLSEFNQPLLSLLCLHACLFLALRFLVLLAGAAIDDPVDNPHKEALQLQLQFVKGLIFDLRQAELADLLEDPGGLRICRRFLDDLLDGLHDGLKASMRGEQLRETVKGVDLNHEAEVIVGL